MDKVSYCFLNQGSSELKKYIKSVAFIDSDILVTVDSNRFSKQTFFSALNVYNFIMYITALYQFNTAVDVKLRNIFWDGANIGKNFSDNYFTAAFRAISYGTRQFVRGYLVYCDLARIKPVAFYTPDEVYGGVFLVFLALRAQARVFTNFTELSFSFSGLSFKNISDYSYTCRNSAKRIVIPTPDMRTKGKVFMERVLGGDSKQADYSVSHRPNSLTFSMFKRARHVPRVLVAGHIANDAPSSHDFDYHSLFSWQREVMCKLNSTDAFDVYVKKHPATPRYKGQISFSRRLQEQFANAGFVWIDETMVVDLKDFDIILSCNGSILYEASYLGVKGLTFSRGFSTHLTNCQYVARKDFQISSITEALIPVPSVASDNDCGVIYDWHVRQDISSMKHLVTPDLLNSFNDGVYRLCSIEVDGIPSLSFNPLEI